MLEARGLAKRFVLHLQGGVVLDVLRDVSFAVAAGECVALSGPSGAGKSTLLRMLYGGYRADAGSILVRHDGAPVELVGAAPRAVLAVRARTLGYVSQFLRVVPRVSAVDIVAEAAGGDHAKAARLLSALNIAPRLQALPPATFSGGEQQRVNLARGFVAGKPVLLLDEPTASLDADNRDIVIGMIGAAKARGAAIVGIFHDRVVREAVADREIPLTPMQDRA